MLGGKSLFNAINLKLYTTFGFQLIKSSLLLFLYFVVLNDKQILPDKKL